MVITICRAQVEQIKLILSKKFLYRFAIFLPVNEKLIPKDPNECVSFRLIF